MSRWDLARARAQSGLREYKPVAPVGEHVSDSLCCRQCGTHVCSCERQACYTLSGISYTKPEPLSAEMLDAWRDTTPREGGTLTREMCGAPPKPEPREYMSRGEFYARKYGEGVPVPAEPTLVDAPVPPNPGPVGPRRDTVGYEYCDCHHMVLRRDCPLQ